MESCVKFLEGKLKLKVNRKKSTTGRPGKLKFLGFSLYKLNGKIGIRVHGKSLKRFTERLKTITSRKRGSKIEKIMEELKTLINGWLGYYSIADIRYYLRRINEWLRRRMRQLFWKRWKRIKTKAENLIKLGATKSNAWQWANTRKGYWCIAGSWILTTTLNNQFFEQLGFPNVIKRYDELQRRFSQLELLRGIC